MNKQTATGLGIAGFVVLMLSVFIPIYGLYIGGLALALAAIGAFFGDRVFAILTVTVSAVKVWFLSPSFALMTASYNNTNDDSWIIQAVAIGAHAIPLIAMFLGSKRDAGGANESRSDPSNGPGMPGNR